MVALKFECVAGTGANVGIDQGLQPIAGYLLALRKAEQFDPKRIPRTRFFCRLHCAGYG